MDFKIHHPNSTEQAISKHMTAARDSFIGEAKVYRNQTINNSTDEYIVDLLLSQGLKLTYSYLLSYCIAPHLGKPLSEIDKLDKEFILKILSLEFKEKFKHHAKQMRENNEDWFTEFCNKAQETETNNKPIN